MNNDDLPWMMTLVVLGVFAIGIVFGWITDDNHETIRQLFLGEGRIEWETLVTGLAAIIAAFMTVRKLNDQIKQANDIEADHTRRRERAARAELPMSLVEFTDTQGRRSRS